MPSKAPSLPAEPDIRLAVAQKLAELMRRRDPSRVWTPVVGRPEAERSPSVAS